MSFLEGHKLPDKRRLTFAVIMVVVVVLMLFILFKTLANDITGDDKIEATPTPVTTTTPEPTMTPTPKPTRKPTPTVRPQQGVGDIGVGSAITPKPDGSHFDIENRPESYYESKVDWSSGWVTSTEFLELMYKAAKLYEDKLELDGGNYKVTPKFLTIEEMESLGVDVSYQVKKGDMYVHLHLDIKEGSKDTVTELKTLILRYDVNRLVLGD